jgi:hypothetical protein
MHYFWIPLVFLAASVQAQEATTSAEQALALRGFGTVGFAQASNSQGEFLRDLSQPNGVSNHGSLLIDTILGLQLNYRASDKTELAAQVVSHQRYDGSFTPELAWAFAKYEWTPRVSFRVGRIGTEFLMQSDSRMVGYSYLPVRPPVNFYGIVPINYGDGADLQLRLPLGDGVLKGSLYLGQAQEQLPTYDVSGSPVRAASLGYDKGPLQFRLIHAESDLANSVMGDLATLRSTLAAMGATQAASALDMKGTLGAYDSVGLAYDDGSWQIQAALNRVTHGTVLTENSQAGYFNVARRMGNVSPYLGYSWTVSEAKSLATGLSGPAAAMLNPAVQAALQSSHQDQHTTTLGLRWDFARNLDLKVQLDWVNGQPSSTLLYDHLQSNWDGHTTVFSLAMDFVF